MKLNNEGSQTKGFHKQGMYFVKKERKKRLKGRKGEEKGNGWDERNGKRHEVWKLRLIDPSIYVYMYLLDTYA